MGITNNCAKFLFYSKSIGISFNETLMLGRLRLYANRSHIEYCINKFNNNDKNINQVKFNDEYSEPLFEILGARLVESLDFSDYEKASIIHDLNLPLPEKYYNSFSAIVDGGTIEHVFNFPAAIKNCMRALKVGGHYLGITPVNNSMGHGFYQFSPELYYRIFSIENGFKIKKMFIYAYGDDDDITWYEVADPKDVKDRVTITNSIPTYLLVVAEKLSDKSIFTIIPQQSDYTNTWAINGLTTQNTNKQSKLLLFYKKITPKRIKVILRNLYDIIYKEKTDTIDLGTINPIHFKKFEL